MSSIRDEPAISRRRAFTVTELLVSIAIMALLVALLLPAVQASREMARQTECRNHLRQMGLAVQNFESANGFYPSNGWGFLWIGDPDRGAGPRQPGGWIYQLLPYMDGDALVALGRGLDPAAKSETLGAMTATPQTLFKCPSRPGSQVTPRNPDLMFRNSNVPLNVAKTDYAISEGDYVTNTPAGPMTLAEGDDPNYPWTDVSRATGVSFLRSRIRAADITDGTSQTYLIGEKCVSQTAYLNADDSGHDAPMASGVDWDINRWTTWGPLPDGLKPQVQRFGSAHVNGCNFVLCDGSVRNVSYLIDRIVHQRLGNRRDGAANE